MFKRILYFVIALLMALSTYSGLIRLPVIVYYVCIMVFLLLVALSGGFKKIPSVSWSLLAFLLICFISIVINDPPAIFKSYQRYLLFTTIVISFSNLFRGKVLNTERHTFFHVNLVVASLFSIGSFFAYFLGINMFIRNGELLDAGGVGHFSGLTNHSMMLGPISVLAALFLFHGYLNSKEKYLKFLYGIAMIMSVGSVLFSASRGALVGLLVGLVAMLYRYVEGKKVKMLGYGFVVVFILALSFPIWQGAIEGVMQKNTVNLENGGVFYSRETKYTARFAEINDNFFTGVGFAAIDTSLDSYDYETGTVEPGSSWLGVFSMTGFWGLVLFFIVVSKAMLNAYKTKDKSLSMLSFAVLSFFFVHLVIEGYVLAGGNILCMLFWLSIGYSEART